MAISMANNGLKRNKTISLRRTKAQNKNIRNALGGVRLIKKNGHRIRVFKPKHNLRLVYLT